MAIEINSDLGSGQLYLSQRLSSRGKQDYPRLLSVATQAHDECWLAAELRQHGRINLTEERRKPKGGFTTARVPVTAPETLAEGEFNRFYLRALCLRAIEEGTSELIIYRAKPVENPRPDWAAKIGTAIRTLCRCLRLRSWRP